MPTVTHIYVNTSENEMKFKLEVYVMHHGIISTLISMAALAISHFTGGAHFLFSFAGTLFYLGRELCDLEKLYDWDFKMWNSADLLIPLLVNTALYLILWNIM
jgi:hypothetical protein